eukprot:5547002-Pleurochrysis_carterae.AAC.1
MTTASNALLSLQVLWSHKEPKEQRCHKSNLFRLYVRALFLKLRWPMHTKKTRTAAARKVVTCHGGDELDKWRPAQGVFLRHALILHISSPTARNPVFVICLDFLLSPRTSSCLP